MRFFGLIVLLLWGARQPVLAQNCWTNTAGHAFNAELSEITDTHAVFVMQDGTTNRLALTALNNASQKTARKALGMPEIPVCFLPTFNLCRKDLLRIEDLYADERLDVPQWRDACAKILAGFRSQYYKHKLFSGDYPNLEKRLLSGMHFQ